MNDYGMSKQPFLFVIDYKKNEAEVFLENEIPSDVFFKVGNYSNFNAASNSAANMKFTISPISIEDYRKSFNIVQSYLKRGDSYLVNLTKPTTIHTSTNLCALLQNCKSDYVLFYKDTFLVFSPETFVRIEGAKVMSYPMKGTIDASITNAEKIILQKEKEAAEHATIVDLIRNDLSTFANKVRVEKYRYVKKIRTTNKPLLQVSSKVSGEIKPEFQGRLGDIFDLALPAGSVTGAPKKKTLEIIDEAENYERGFYTGVFGWFNGENLDSAVMIRFIQNTPNGLIYKSGGGITAMSDCEEEYEELLNKIYVPIS